MELQDENVEGSLLQIQFNYSSLAVLDVSSEITDESFQSNYIDKYCDEEPSDGEYTFFIRTSKFWLRLIFQIFLSLICSYYEFTQ